MYTIEIQGLNNLEKGLAKSQQVTQAILGRAMQKSLTALTNSAKANSPYKTGNLRRSIHNLMHNLLEGEVSPATPYAEYVETGTRPHVILPRTKKVLAFKVGGKLVFARKVQHPGFSGRYYMRRTAIQGERVVEQIYQEAAEQIAQMLAS